MVYILIATFFLSLLVSVGASAAFTRRLEGISDHFHFSPGLLSLLGALGANIPNYVAALAAAIDGQVGVGIGIIIGSNVYNVAVILGLAAFASPGHHGLALSRREAQDARQVGSVTLAIMLTTALATGFFFWQGMLRAPTHAPQLFVLVSAALLVLNVLTLGLLALLFTHAFRREPEPEHQAKGEIRHDMPTLRAASRGTWALARLLSETIIALGVALGGVIVMVQAGQAAAQDLHLPPAVLSLLILAVATSLPNTIVAFLLARTNRASASVEEIFSSNSVNAALGIALPLLFWSGIQDDRLLLFLDAPMMILLTLLALLCIGRLRISRVTGLLLILIYVGWVILHLILW